MYNQKSYVIPIGMTYNRSKVGPKGQVVIPKEIRDKAGIRPGSQVLVEMSGDDVLIKRSPMPTESYVDYYVTTYSKKLKRKIDVKKIIEEEEIERARLR
jgi:AbrB family looped-hinge helix DNA binding protein